MRTDIRKEMPGDIMDSRQSGTENDICEMEIRNLLGELMDNWASRIGEERLFLTCSIWRRFFEYLIPSIGAIDH